MDSISMSMVTGGWAWFILTLIFFFALWVTEEWEWFGSAFLCLAIVFLLFISKFSLFSLIAANPWATLYIVLGYLVVGVAWSFAKLYLYLLDKRDELREFHYPRSAGESAEAVAARTREYILANIPKARQNKTRIVSWMAYWPLSLIWTMLSDIVKRIWNRIFQVFEHLYDRVIAIVFREFLNP